MPLHCLARTHQPDLDRVADRNSNPDSQLLPEVEPTFNWVRLAQRIPVRIRLDEIPQGMNLSAGMTASVQVHEDRVTQ